MSGTDCGVSCVKMTQSSCEARGQWGWETGHSFLGPTGPTAPCCPPTPGGQAPADCPPSCLPPGHGDYAYQQSYTEQTYDRSFEESTQHYYEGGKARAPEALTQRVGAGGAGWAPASHIHIWKQDGVQPCGGHRCTRHDAKGPGPGRRQTWAARGRWV